MVNSRGMWNVGHKIKSGWSTLVLHPMLSLINISDSLDILMRETGSLYSCPGVRICMGWELFNRIESRKQNTIYFISSEILEYGLITG